MFRFILFLGFLVGIAYVLTEPPAPKTALSANEIPVRNDKPLLTSWGPTLASLRDGVRGDNTDGAATTLVASNNPAFGSEATDPATTAAEQAVVEPAVVATVAGASKPAPQRANAAKPDRATALASREQPVTAEPVVDRIAAALPPQRRGLFGRPLKVQRVQAPRVTRQAQARQVEAAPRKRGFFKRLTGRAKQPARAWALGPAR